MLHVFISFFAQAPYYQIFVKGAGGKTTTLWTKASDLIDDIKCKMAHKSNIPVKELQQSSSRAAA